MFLKTDTAWAPWHVARSDDKKRARLNIITDLLKQIPYETTPRPKIELPKRDKAHGYVESDYAAKLIPEDPRGVLADSQLAVDVGAVIPMRM